MLGNGTSKDNNHFGDTYIRNGSQFVDEDAFIGGDLIVDGTINLSDVTVDGNLTINPPNCLKTDCLEEATLNNGVGVESDLNINATKNLSTDKINPATPATGIEINNEYKLPIVKGTSNQVLTQVDALGNCQFSDIPNSSTTIPLEWRLIWYGQGRTNPYNTFVFNSLVGIQPIGTRPTLNSSNFLRDAILYQESTGRFEVTHDGSNDVTIQFKFTYLNDLIPVEGFSENLVYTNSFTGFFKITHYIYNLFVANATYPFVYSLVTLEINDPSNTSNRYLATWIGESSTTQNGLFPDTSGVPLDDTSITQYDLQVSPSFQGSSSVDFYPSGINVWIGADYTVTASGGVGGVVTNPLTENLKLGGFAIIEPLGAVSPSLNIDQLDPTKDIRLKVGAIPKIIVKTGEVELTENLNMSSNNIINVSELNNTSNLKLSSVGGSLDIDSNLIQFISTAVPQGQIDAVGGWEIFNALSMTNNNINNVNALSANQVNTDVIENSGSGFLTFTNLGGYTPTFTSTGLDMNLGEIANVANVKNSGVLNINQNGGTATNFWGNGTGFRMQISNAVFIINGTILNIHDKVIWTPPNQMPSSYLAGYTYIFVGSRTTATTQNITVDCKIMGLGKDVSFINYTGTTTLFNITDVNVEIQDLTITSSQNDGLPINATNFSLGAFNNGREKILNMKGVQIRNSKRGCQFFGFDLIDLNNCLFTYIESGFTGAPQAFIQFTATSKVQLSSCELLRFYQEASNPTPANFYNGDMVGFRNDPVSLVGIGAVNVTGCLLHPQQNQNGLFFDPTLTILENTVSSNTFIDINLNTPTYQVVQINNLAGGAGEKSVIEGNSIVPNLRSQVTYVLSATNTTPTDLSVNNPNVLNTGGLAIGLVTQFANLTSAGLITYLKKRSANFIITASANLEVVAGGAGQQVGLGLRVNGVDVPLAYSYITLDSAGTAPKQCTLNFTGLANQNDTFELTIFNASGNNNVIASYVNFAGIEI